MTPGSEVAPSQSAALQGVSDEDLAALRAAQDNEIDADLIQTPILKIGQPLTREVQNDLAEPGDFIDSLTGDSLGSKIEFIVADYKKGRFATDNESGLTRVAFGKVVPESWAELSFIGEENVGVPFPELDDAEERYKARANAGEIEWGKGPRVSTTHNFTGLVVVDGLEDDDDAELRPVRLSLQRTNMPAVRKILTFYQAKLRRTAWWDQAFDLATEKKTFNKGSAYLLVPRLGRVTLPHERQAAAELALAVLAGRVEDNAEAAVVDAPVEPKAEGGLAV
jgi:hypothetical protein